MSRVYITAYPRLSHRVWLTTTSNNTLRTPAKPLSIKGAFELKTGPSGTPDGIRASVEEAIQALDRTKTIDALECARSDPIVPIETLVKALAELVKEGIIGGVGLSKVGANTIRKAHAVHSISVAEVEPSLFAPDALNNGNRGRLP